MGQPFGLSPNELTEIVAVARKWAAANDLAYDHAHETERGLRLRFASPRTSEFFIELELDGVMLANRPELLDYIPKALDCAAGAFEQRPGARVTGWRIEPGTADDFSLVTFDFEESKPAAAKPCTAGEIVVTFFNAPSSTVSVTDDHGQEWSQVAFGPEPDADEHDPNREPFRPDCSVWASEDAPTAMADRVRHEAAMGLSSPLYLPDAEPEPKQESWRDRPPML